MSANFRQQFSAALERLNAGDLPDAATQCDALSRVAPDDPAVLQLHATILLRAGQPAAARDAIRHSLRRRPGHVPSLLIAARAALVLGFPDQAVPPLCEAVQGAPALPEPAFLLCRTLLELAHPTLDATIAQTAQKHPDQAAEWQSLGLALQRAQRPALAMDAFDRAAAADPTLAAAQFGRGLLLRDAGRMDRARAALERAVALDPAGSGAWFALGLTCQDLGDEAAAAAAYRAALHLRDNFAEAAVNLGISLQHLGDMEGAMDAYRSAMRSRPDSFGRIAQAVTAASTGMLWLDLGALRRQLA